jgi:hypothetical protein
MKKLAPYIAIVIVVAVACYNWLDYLDMRIENAKLRAELSSNAHQDMHQQKMAQMILDHDVHLVKALGQFAAKIKNERVGHAWRKCPILGKPYQEPGRHGVFPDSPKSPSPENSNLQPEKPVTENVR